MDLNIRVAGEAGQGVQTTGNLLVGAFADLGLHVLATQSYMSRIRGGLNWFDIRIGQAELFAGRDDVDLLVALTPEAMEVLRQTVRAGGLVLLNASDGGGEGVIAIDLSAQAKAAGGSAVMANAVASGAVLALMGYDASALDRCLAGQFGKKDPDVVEKNVRCVRRGAETVADHAGALVGPSPAGAPSTVYSGSQAVGAAAAAAGVKFVSAYPMTPSTGVFTYLAGVADEYGIVVEQAEDEIAAINMVCGAAYAGAVALTTTSGGGFALMTEGVSLAGMMELPVVIMIAQRPGPATGLPTRTAQQDLAFALHAGHGEFARAIFAPGTHAQAHALTRRALETAHRYQTPVMLLTDQYLADMQKNVPPLPADCKPIDRCIVTGAGSDYVRYAVTDSGVSPRALPGAEALVVCDSDEHTENGHITEDLTARVRQNDKRLAKVRGLTDEAMPPDYYGPPDADVLLVTWGSTYGPGREAVDILGRQGVSAAMLHFAQVWPVNVPAAREALAGRRRIVCVEGNSTGQFAAILRERNLLEDCQSVLRCDGMGFTGDGIAREVSA